LEKALWNRVGLASIDLCDRLAAAIEDNGRTVVLCTLHRKETAEVVTIAWTVSGFSVTGTHPPHTIGTPTHHSTTALQEQL